MANIILVSTKQPTVTLVDDEDFGILSMFRWTLNRDGYVQTSGQSIRIHRVIMRAAAGTTVDHINGDKLDNRKANLRIATRAQQSMNRSAARTHNGRAARSKHKGVDYRIKNKAKPWRARIGVNGVRMELGNFASEMEAAVAYNAAAVKYFGEFARLNAA